MMKARRSKNAPFWHHWNGGEGWSRCSIYFVQDCNCRSKQVRHLLPLSRLTPYLLLPVNCTTVNKMKKQNRRNSKLLFKSIPPLNTPSLPSLLLHFCTKRKPPSLHLLQVSTITQQRDTLQQDGRGCALLSCEVKSCTPNGSLLILSKNTKPALKCIPTSQCLRAFHYQ